MHGDGERVTERSLFYLFLFYDGLSRRGMRVDGISRQAELKTMMITMMMRALPVCARLISKLAQVVLRRLNLDFGVVFFNFYS